MPEDGGLIGQALIGVKPVNAWVHTYTKPQISSTRSRSLGWRIHESVEDTKLSTNKQHSLSERGREREREGERGNGERGKGGGRKGNIGHETLHCSWRDGALAGKTCKASGAQQV